MTGLEDAARQFVGVLESLRIPYAIMGGLAVRVHALPRPTFDVDFTVSLPRESLGRLYEEAEKLGFTVPDSQLGGWGDQVHADAGTAPRGGTAGLSLRRTSSC